MMHLVKGRRWETFTSGSWRLGASWVVVLMYSGTLAVKRLASYTEMLLAKRRHGLGC
jgi:hypothetical protein